MRNFSKVAVFVCNVYNTQPLTHYCDHCIKISFIIIQVAENFFSEIAEFLCFTSRWLKQLNKFEI